MSAADAPFGTPRNEAADLLLTARWNYDKARTDLPPEFGILTEAMDAAMFRAVWYLNRNKVETAKVYAEAWSILADRRRKLVRQGNQVTETTLS